MEHSWTKDCSDNLTGTEGYQTLIVEPFYGGSHQQLVDLLMLNVPCCVKYTLPAKKWHWKARTSALHFAQVIPRSECFEVLFASSVLNLAELVALRTDLGSLHKVLYFHENQLVYPIRKQQERDFQYGYNQILSCLAADTILFNSRYNMDSFLSAIDSFLGLIPIPGYKSKGLHRLIRPKCRVLYFPLRLPELNSISAGDASGGCRPVSHQVKILRNEVQETETRDLREDVLQQWTSPKEIEERSLCRDADDFDETKEPSSLSDRKGCLVLCSPEEIPSNENKTDTNVGKGRRDECACDQKASDGSCDMPLSRDGSCHMTGADRVKKPLHILWAHRWEHDKNPDLLFHCLIKLHEMDLNFNVSVLGEQFTSVPDIFCEAKAKLQDHIVNWGYLPNKDDYYRVLFAADVAVSTADHEFFGVVMLEAVHLRCYPLCPNRLVYPEIFPKDYLYSTSQQLLKKLRAFCQHPHLVRNHNLQVAVEQYSWETLKEDYLSVLSSHLNTPEKGVSHLTTEENESSLSLTAPGRKITDESN